MKYKVNVTVEIRSTDTGNYNPLRLSEESEIELDSLSSAANVLVRLHEFFQALRNNPVKR